MLTQTLPFFGVNVSNFQFLDRMMKGCYNFNPPRARYTFTWDVNVVLNFLFTLYPLEELSLKDLTLKLIALVALATAARAQSLSALDLKFMYKNEKEDIIVFQIRELLKTSRPGTSLPNIILRKFDKPQICVVRTLLHYISRTKDVRKSSSLFISYVTYCKVTSSTLSRWLKTVLLKADINIDVFKGHSFRGASTSAAFASGCSLKDILATANWSSAKTFYKFYHKDIKQDTMKDFSTAVFNS